MNCNTPLISIIIPVYNGESYVRECIESAQGQTYRNIEIIVVDDGSTDKTSSMVASMMGHDARIKLYHQVNMGTSAARNRGLEESKGEYITFIDADDTVDSRYVEVLYILLASNGVDMSCCSIGSIEVHYDFTNDTYDVVESHGYISDVLYKRYSNNSVWGKLYTRGMWESERFKKMRFEDLEIFPRLCLNASKVVVTDAPLYYYRKNSNSFMHTMTSERFDMLKATEMIIAYMEENAVSEELKMAARSRRVSACFNAMLLSYGYQQFREVHEEAWRGIKSLRRSCIADGKSSIKLRLALLLSFLGRYPLIFINKMLHISK